MSGDLVKAMADLKEEEALKITKEISWIILIQSAVFVDPVTQRKAM